MPALLALVAALPDILVTAPKLGAAIYNLLHLHAGDLPEEVKAKLADVKLRQAVEDAEFDSDLPGGSPAVVPAAQVPEAVARLTAENARLLAEKNELLARLQAGESEGAT